jgi:hypothetical protein
MSSAVSIGDHCKKFRMRRPASIAGSAAQRRRNFAYTPAVCLAGTIIERGTVAS